MPNIPSDNQNKLEELLEANLTLAKENNELLRILKRNNTIALVLRVVWYAIILGVPFILYFYFLDPLVGDNSALLDIYGELLP